jgi:large subunit ribosomal protein L25
MAFTLNAKSRTLIGDKARADGNLPAVVYGAGGEALNLELSYVEFAKLYQAASESSLIDLNVDGTAAGKILLQEVQFEPVKGRIRHVDLRRIDMSKPLTTMVELHFMGEPPAVKAMGGTLVHNVNEIEVKCLPSDLIDYIEVDLTVLKTFEDSIKVQDLAVPANITVLSPHADNVVAKVTPALTEDEIKAMETDSSANVDLSQIETAGKKKEEEPAEGAEGDKKDDKKDAGKKDDKK